MINPYVKERLVNYAQPRMDAVVENYDVMMDEMRALITAAFPGGEWSSARNAVVSPVCDAIDSATMNADELSDEELCVGTSALWNYNAMGDLTAKVRLLGAISRLGNKYGFSVVDVEFEGVDSFQAKATDEFGARYEIGGYAHVTISYTTGVHLTRMSSARLAA